VCPDKRTAAIIDSPAERCKRQARVDAVADGSEDAPAALPGSDGQWQLLH